MKATNKPYARSASRDGVTSKSMPGISAGVFLGNKVLNELRILMRLASSNGHRSQLASSR